MANNLDFALIVRLIDNLTAPLGQIGRALDGVASKAAKLREVGAQLQGVGAAATAVGAGMTAGIVKTVAAFADLEEATTRAEVAFMGVGGAVDPVFEQISAKAVDLGNKLPGNTRDFMLMAASLKEAGLSAKSIAEGGLEATAYLRVLMGNLAPEQASKLTATFKTSLGIAEKDFVAFVDVLQRQKFAFGISPETFAYTAKYVGPVLNMLKIGGLEASKQFVALTGALASAGIEGETAGTGLAASLGKLPNIAQEIKKAKLDGDFAKAGIKLDFYDKNGNFQGLPNFVAQLEQLKKLNPEKQQEVIKKLFGEENVKTVSTLMSQGVEGLNRASQKMAEQANLQDRVNKMLGTLKLIWESAKGTIDNLLAAAGSLFGDDLKAFSKTINNTSEAITGWIKANPELARTIGMVVVGLTGFFAAVGTLGLVGGTIIAGLGMLGGALAILLGPIGLVAGAFAGAAYLIMDNWNALSTFFDLFSLEFQGGLEPLEPILKTVVSAWQSLVGSVGGGSAALAGWLKSGGMMALAEWGAQLGALAKQAVVVLADVLAGIGSAAQKAWGVIGPGLEGLGRAFSGLKTSLSILWIQVEPLLQQLFSAFAGVGSSGASWEGFGRVVGIVAKGVIDAISGIVWIISGLVLTVADVIKAVVAVFDGGSGKISDALGAAGRAILAAFGGLPGEMMGIGANIMLGLIKGIGGAAGQAVSAVGDIASGMIGKFTGLLGIKSPSRVFAGFGSDVIAGLGGGLAANQNSAIATMAGVGAAVARGGLAALRDGIQGAGAASAGLARIGVVAAQVGAVAANAAGAVAMPQVAVARERAPGGEASGGMQVTINITVHAPSGDGAGITAAVRGAVPDITRQLADVMARQARTRY